MSKGNDQVERTMPNTDAGGHDTAGADGKPRTERSGEILGTPDPDGSDLKHTTAAREKATEKTDYITAEVDRANREELPLLGGNIEDDWEADSKPARKAAPAPAAPAPAVTSTTTTTARTSDR